MGKGGKGSTLHPITDSKIVMVDLGGAKKDQIAREKGHSMAELFSRSKLFAASALESTVEY